MWGPLFPWEEATCDAAFTRGYCRRSTTAKSKEGLATTAASGRSQLRPTAQETPSSNADSTHGGGRGCSRCSLLPDAVQQGASREGCLRLHAEELQWLPRSETLRARRACERTPRLPAEHLLQRCLEEKRKKANPETKTESQGEKRISRKKKQLWKFLSRKKNSLLISLVCPFYRGSARSDFSQRHLPKYCMRFSSTVAVGYSPSQTSALAIRCKRI